MTGLEPATPGATVPTGARDEDASRQPVLTDMDLMDSEEVPSDTDNT